MKFVLTKKPKNPTIIQGFPSIGLVSTIVTKFLTDHLDVEEIGHIESNHIIPLTAIHKSKVINPITIFHNKKYNLVIIQGITEVSGFEWELSTAIFDIAKELSAREIIVVEGIPTQQESIKTYYCSTSPKVKIKTNQLNEGIIMGVTAAMLLKDGKIPVTCIFSETHSQLPDSEAAARVVEILSGYTKIKIDSKPLLEAAKKFEANLKLFMEKTREAANAASTSKKEKDGETSYIG